ncbi:ABC transporter substrate-binding protein [Thiothrix winogradskyi]|uniref:ABC transporter substrate-binding protein n=1 Tax=Thiothrix winogradskyi TaxID=96472 RepID=A0ABY3T3Z8_9GAMM|nr:ABC transporter substrate-binding protein [Thiothrix winogradskyi]UJS25481.1 ABC transporter substrate-binding protein [Thiothrix winogradskyi]
MISRILVLLALLLSNAVSAADFPIGYLQLQDDARYSGKRTFAQYLMQPLGRPYAGAEVALKESKFHGSAVGAEFKLQQVKGKDTADLLAQVESLSKQGVQFFVVDTPAATLAELAAATKGKDLLLLNISAREDSLRQAQCQAHLLHLIPNYAMLTDALTQYLKVRKWNEALLLHGGSDEDLQLTAAFERSAKRYGVEIDEKRPFELSNDPRHRDQNNVALLTADADYDVIFVADTHGEFARNVPYQSIKPQLVVGSEGLAPAAWHWAWERHGAPQLEKRFEKHAGRPMRDVDWAAWMAVKAIAEAVQRTASTDFAKLREHLLSDAFILDGFKGKRSNFRPWDRQLRQPILLGTHNWVVERLPLDGFLHQTNNLDTLGFDERDSQCKF